MNLSNIVTDNSNPETLVLQTTATAGAIPWASTASTNWFALSVTNVLIDTNNILLSFSPGASATFTIRPGSYIATLQMTSYASNHNGIVFRLRNTATGRPTCQWVNSVIGAGTTVNFAPGANWRQITGFTTTTSTTNILEAFAASSVFTGASYGWPDDEYTVTSTLTLERLG
jgi:hypothetical protein